MSAFDTLTARKSALVLELQRAKVEKKTRRVVELASEAGALEREIAGILQSESPEEALINLVSAGSCFVDARRNIEAVRAFQEALALEPTDAVRTLVKRQLMQLGSVTMPGSIFRAIETVVRGNDFLRRPQIEAYEAALQHFERSNEHAIIQLPVGCGKTGTMSLLPFGIAKGRALVVAPNLEIAQNLRREFDYSEADSFLRKRRVLRNGHGPTCAVLDRVAAVIDADASDFVVANIQQLLASGGQKWFAQFPPDYFDLVLFDEGHHNAADSWVKVHEKFPRAKFTSFTATPIRADGKKVEGKPIYRFPIAAAIREGFIKDIATRHLEPTTIEFVYEGSQQRHSLAEVLKLRENDWFSKGVALAPECNRNIADAAIQCMLELRDGSAHKHQIIAAACSIDHAKSIRSIFKERGLAADVLHSDLPAEERDAVRRKLRAQELDAVVHVQMLGEGADYPTLSVAAIFRPYRHLVPYVQFVGRIMRVNKQNAPGHPDNRGFVVSHVGLHIDRWWHELRELDKDDQQFFEGLANSAREFAHSESPREEPEGRRRFSHPMQVLDEQIERYVQEHFLDRAEAAIVVKDLVRAMAVRGFDLADLGVTEEQLAERLLARNVQVSGRVEPSPVQPQRARQEAQRRLDERVRSGAKQLLNELGFKTGGRKLAMLFPHFQAVADLPVAIILMNNEVNRFLGVGSEERGLLTEEQARTAHDAMDRLIDLVAAAVREKMKKG
jgi:superfamily II DNA or RNA helicase